ncbi:hypothetical protein MBT84_38570 [Streptomyces sp. MBT84]|nr:hypothetical protein [Streptomyces sp. MBT84]
MERSDRLVGRSAPQSLPPGQLRRHRRRVLADRTARRRLHEAVQHDELATTGPYAWVRHPRYDGFLLVMIGFLLQWPTIPTLIMFPVLVCVYLRLARGEEREVAARFGEQWTAYAEHTPAFWPKLRHRPSDARHAPRGAQGPQRPAARR